MKITRQTLLRDHRYLLHVLRTNEALNDEEKERIMNRCKQIENEVIIMEIIE